LRSAEHLAEATALDPNTVATRQLCEAATELLALTGECRGRLDRLGESLTGCPGARRAFDSLEGAVEREPDLPG